MVDKQEATYCYTYRVEMLVQVLAKDEPSASSQLENNGGYVTARKATLVDSVALHNGSE
jgi:hypothetical protein